jgi:hypothetical protein
MFSIITERHERRRGRWGEGEMGRKTKDKRPKTKDKRPQDCTTAGSQDFTIK